VACCCPECDIVCGCQFLAAKWVVSLLLSVEGGGAAVLLGERTELFFLETTDFMPTDQQTKELRTET